MPGIARDNEDFYSGPPPAGSSRTRFPPRSRTQSGRAPLTPTSRGAGLPSMSESTDLHHVDPFKLPEILWIEDIANILGIGLIQARRKCRNGEIPAKRLGKRWFILREELIRVLRPS